MIQIVSTYLNFITGDFWYLDWFVLTFLLWYRKADSDTGLGREHLGNIVTHLHLLILAVAVVTIPTLRWTGVLGLLLTLGLVVHLDCGGLCVLALLVVDVVADLIVHHLL